MSVANTQPKRSFASQSAIGTTGFGHHEYASGTLRLMPILERVQAKTSPVWPLQDYVAYNPYMGFAADPFLATRKYLQSVSNLETLMPVDYYRDKFAQGDLLKADINAAIDEMVVEGLSGAERIDINQIVSLLQQRTDQPTFPGDNERSNQSHRPLRTITETLDQNTGSNWGRVVLDELSKHCAIHYDDGQATWSSPWKELPLFEAWCRAAKHDRRFEILGGKGLRKLVTKLASDPTVAIVDLLNRLNVPTDLWEDFLLCSALAMPGWSAWTKYQQDEAQKRADDNTDFAALLAIRLSYEVALFECFDVRLDWDSIRKAHSVVQQSDQPADDEAIRYALLKANEIAFRKRLLGNLSSRSKNGSASNETERGLAQMAFCIDVRSERIRRHLEGASNAIETFGFAGFFGLPIEFAQLGEPQGSAHCPVLLTPQFKVQEEVAGSDEKSTKDAIKRRHSIRSLRKAWKEFQTSAVGCFSFVETTGLLFGLKLISRSFGLPLTASSKHDGIARGDRDRLGPSLRGIHQQGVQSSDQVEMAESILRGIGIVDKFARLVVFCGHGSQTENNPLKAGLDCGACGGHSGEASARFAAKLLNQAHVRQSLAKRGIEIPDDTYFMSALHNTTTDRIEFYDTYDVPESHRGDLKKLASTAHQATGRTRQERLPQLGNPDANDVIRRSRDWSEIRPEWGLAGNAAFIIAPRELTETVSLDGQAFLHSYDYRHDTGFAVLEQIMTAPMVVAHLINMQYYASTVDPSIFGSGTKTVHNVVGRFGIFSGNGGDLMTGLPWESIHDGKKYQHEPLRLLAVIAAPRQAIESIIAAHPLVEDLLTNSWLQLVAHDDDVFYRYTKQQTWEVVKPDMATNSVCEINACTQSS